MHARKENVDSAPEQQGSFNFAPGQPAGVAYTPGECDPGPGWALGPDFLLPVLRRDCEG